MSRKRGRSPKKQSPTKRGPGRPRKTTRQTPRRITRTRGAATASAVVSAVENVPAVAPEYTSNKPFVVPVTYDEGATPVFKPTKPKHHADKFQLPPPRPDYNNVDAVIMALSRVYLPDTYLIKIFRDTLLYIFRRELHPRDVYKLVPRDILYFFVIIYYMGFCKLPSKQDYWNNGDDIAGDHPVCKAFGMTHKKFCFIWRNIYLTTPRDEVQDGESDDEGELEYQPHTDDFYVVRSDEAEDNFHFDQKTRSMIDITNAGNKLICN